MTDQWIVIPRWDEFQHRDMARSSIPPWIKLYTQLQDDDDWNQLTLRQRGILVGIWMAYARGRRVLGSSPARLGRLLGDSAVRARDLEALNHAGFIQFSASKPARNPASRPASLEVEVDKERPSVLRKPDNGRAYVCTQCAGLPFKTQARLNEHRENVHGIYTT